MSLPENPQSRSEQYLNAIATGDNSGLPAAPESRMKQYLDYIAQNGGGGSGGGALVVHVTVEKDGSTTVYTADKTAGEIINAMPLAFYLNGDTTFPGGSRYLYSPLLVYVDGGDDGYIFPDLDGNFDYEAETLNDYPSHIESGK